MKHLVLAGMPRGAEYWSVTIISLWLDYYDYMLVTLVVLERIVQSLYIVQEDLTRRADSMARLCFVLRAVAEHPSHP